MTAFTGESFAYQNCQTYLQEAGAKTCMVEGCAARSACPIGRDVQYQKLHIQFHMNAFGPRAVDQAL